MIYNTGWANLKPQKLKYTPALAAKAAKFLESGESLTATARAVKVSRASLHNWRERDPALKAAFAVFEANKAKHEAKSKQVRHFKEVADGIVDEACEGTEDAVKAAQEAQAKAKEEKSNTIKAPRRPLRGDFKPNGPKSCTGRRLSSSNKRRLKLLKCSR